MSIRYDKLEGIVLESLNKLITKYYNKNYLIKKFRNNNLINDKIASLEIDKRKYQKKIYDIDFYVKNLYEDKVNQIIDINYFNKLINNYKKEKDNYESILNGVEKKILELKNKTNNIVDNVICNYNKFDKLNIVIIDEFIDNILIGTNSDGNRNIKIIWNIKY